MNPDVIGWIAGGLVALAGTWLTIRDRRRSAARDARVGEITANSEAAKSAQETYSGIIADLRTEVTRLHVEVERLRTELAAERSHRELFAALLAANGIQVPEPPS